jgi:putative oxidoreductase
MTATSLHQPASTVAHDRASTSGLRTALHRLVATPKDPVATLLRLTLGVVMFPHGAQKVLGWFGGYGFDGTMKFLTGTIHAPVLFAALAIAAEFLGSLGLVFGLFTRVAALGILGVMVVAVLTVHLPNGFFMNWTGAQAGEGFEYHLLAGALALALIVRGAGAWSLDRRLAEKVRGTR